MFNRYTHSNSVVSDEDMVSMLQAAGLPNILLDRTYLTLSDNIHSYKNWSEIMRKLLLSLCVLFAATSIVLAENAQPGGFLYVNGVPVDIGGGGGVTNVPAATLLAGKPADVIFEDLSKQITAQYIAIEIITNNGDLNRVGIQELGVTRVSE